MRHVRNLLDSDILGDDTQLKVVISMPVCVGPHMGTFLPSRYAIGRLWIAEVSSVH